MSILRKFYNNIVAGNFSSALQQQLCTSLLAAPSEPASIAKIIIQYYKKASTPQRLHLSALVGATFAHKMISSSDYSMAQDLSEGFELFAKQLPRDNTPLVKETISSMCVILIGEHALAHHTPRAHRFQVMQLDDDLADLFGYIIVGFFQLIGWLLENGTDIVKAGWELLAKLVSAFITNIPELASYIGESFSKLYAAINNISPSEWMSPMQLTLTDIRTAGTEFLNTHVLSADLRSVMSRCRLPNMIEALAGHIREAATALSEYFAQMIGTTSTVMSDAVDSNTLIVILDTASPNEITEARNAIGQRVAANHRLTTSDEAAVNLIAEKTETTSEQVKKQIATAAAKALDPNATTSEQLRASYSQACQSLGVLPSEEDISIFINAISEQRGGTPAAEAVVPPSEETPYSSPNPRPSQAPAETETSPFPPEDGNFDPLSNIPVTKDLPGTAVNPPEIEDPSGAATPENISMEPTP